MLPAGATLGGVVRVSTAVVQQFIGIEADA